MIAVWTALVNGAMVSLGLTAAVWVLLRFQPGHRWNARTRYVVWMATLVVSVTLPVFYAPIEFSYPNDEAVPVRSGPPLSNSNAIRPLVGEVSLTPRLNTERVLRESIVSPDPPPSAPIFPVRLLAGTWIAWLGGAWLLGSLFMLVRLIASWVVLESRKAQAFALPDDCATRLEKRLRDGGGPARNIRLALSPNIRSPIASGPYRPTVLIPSRMFDELDAFELDQLVLHEAAHLGRRDDYALIVQRIIEAVFVFYPVVSWIKSHIEFEREVACDDFVVETTRRPREYARCLTRAAELAVGAYSYPLAAFAARTNSRLEERVDLLLDKTRIGGTKLLWAQASAMVLVLAVASWAVAQQPGFVAFARTPQTSLASVPDTSLAGASDARASSVSVAPGVNRTPQASNTSKETMPIVPLAQEVASAGDPAASDEVDSVLIRIPVTVTDSENRFVTDLGREHFSLLLDGEEREISEFSIPGDPSFIAIINEVTRSADAQALESELPRQVAEQVMRNGDPLQRNIFLLASSEATGPVSLQAQIEIAAREMQSAGNPGRAIVIVSGKAGHWAGYTEEQMRNTAAAVDLPIYAVSRGGDGGSGPGGLAAQSSRSILDQITEQTGGLHVVIDDEREVSAAADRMRVAMGNLYVLGLELDSSERDERYRRIQVAVRAPSELLPLRAVHRAAFRFAAANPVTDLSAGEPVEQGRDPDRPFGRSKNALDVGGEEVREVAAEIKASPIPEPVPVQSEPSQELPEPQGPATEVTGIGRITEINVEERWFELRSRIPEPVQVRTSDSGVWAGAVNVGIGISGVEPRIARVPDDPRTGEPAPDPRVDPRTGRRDPRLDPRLPSPVMLPLPGGPTPGRIGYVTSRVLVTDDTLIRHNTRRLRFGQLNVGDTVALTGMTRGDQVEATLIDRQFTGP